MELRRALRAYAREHRGQCLGDDKIAAYLDRQEQYDRVADHISCCQSCRVAVMMEIDWRRLWESVMWITDKTAPVTDTTYRRQP